MDIHALIKKYRTKAKMTQQQMADHLYIQKNTYNQYENGKRRIDTETFFKIAEILNIHIAIRDKYKEKQNIPMFKPYFNESFDDGELSGGMMTVFIGTDPFLFYITSKGIAVRHLPIEYLYIKRDEEKKMKALFKLSAETFDVEAFNSICPLCGKYKKYRHDMDTFDSGFCSYFTTDEGSEYIHKCLELFANSEDLRLNRSFMRVNSRGELNL
jgi:transcriptional regulator with XRE-family HTH domain